MSYVSYYQMSILTFIHSLNMAGNYHVHDFCIVIPVSSWPIHNGRSCIMSSSKVSRCHEQITNYIGGINIFKIGPTEHIMIFCSLHGFSGTRRGRLEHQVDFGLFNIFAVYFNEKENRWSIPQPHLGNKHYLAGVQKWILLLSFISDRIIRERWRLIWGKVVRGGGGGELSKNIWQPETTRLDKNYQRPRRRSKSGVITIWMGFLSVYSRHFTLYSWFSHQPNVCLAESL